MISATNISNAFRGTQSFSQDLSSRDVSNVTKMTNMLDNAALSSANYDALLSDWSALGSL